MQNMHQALLLCMEALFRKVRGPTARKRKRCSIRCIRDALPLYDMAAGSLSLKIVFSSGLRGLTPVKQDCYVSGRLSQISRNTFTTTEVRTMEYVM